MGDFWYDTSSDILYVRINDGSNPLWLDISSIPGSSTYATLSGISSGTGYVGSVGYTGSASIIPGYVGSVGYTGSASTIQGATGYVGSSGYAGTIALGYSYIGSAGTRARITNSGTASAAIFDFILPLGYTGSASTIQGATGYVGSAGYAGTIALGYSYIGSAGTRARITNSGTASAAIFDFILPLGYTGSAGTGSGGITGIYQPAAFTSAAIQTAIDAANTAGGGTVMLPVGDYNCTSQIIVKKNVKLEGLGQPTYMNSTPPTLTGGAILKINWGSGAGNAGDPTKAAVILKNCSGIVNVGFDYPSQSPTATTPTEYGSSVQINDNPCINQYVTDCYFNKSYIAIDFRGIVSTQSSGIAGYVIERNAGSPLLYGIAINFVVDWGTISNNHFNSGGANYFQNPSNICGISKWALENGTAFYAGGCDWLNVSNLQVWGYNIGVYIEGSAGYEAGGPYSFNQCNLDACKTGVFLSGTISQMVNIDQCTFAPFRPATYAINGTTVSTSIINGTGVSLASGTVCNGLTFTGNYIFASGFVDYVMWLGQATQTLSNFIISNNYSIGSNTYPAITMASGTNIQVINNIFNNYTSVVNFGSATLAVSAYNNGSAGTNVGSAVVQQKTSGTYPIAISDHQKVIEANGGVTITLGVLTTSVKIDIVQITTGVLTISAGAGATIYSRVGNGTVYLSAQYAGCTVYNNSGGTLANWVVVGDISAT